MDWNGFKGAAKRLDDIDLPRIGSRIGVGEDEIHAFMDVEAAGSGFDRQGRPKMLFEPHVFYRNLSGAKRAKAVEQGLAYARWQKGKYPADSYPRLFRAMVIDETAALKAASWGLGQVLGENYRQVGYATPQAMVRAFMEDEEAHLEAMIEFLITNNIDDDLRDHNWSVVARVYNGPGYKTHDYDGRMARAFAKWQRIKDTPWDGKRELPPPPTSVARVVAYQRMLSSLGYDVGPVDGIRGPLTINAVKAFQRSHGLTVDGLVGPQTWAALERLLAPRPPDVPIDDGDDDTPDEAPSLVGRIIGLAVVAAGIIGAGILIWSSQ